MAWDQSPSIYSGTRPSCLRYVHVYKAWRWAIGEYESQYVLSVPLLRNRFDKYPDFFLEVRLCCIWLFFFVQVKLLRGDSLLFRLFREGSARQLRFSWFSEISRELLKSPRSAFRAGMHSSWRKRGVKLDCTKYLSERYETTKTRAEWVYILYHCYQVFHRLSIEEIRLVEIYISNHSGEAIIRRAKRRVECFNLSLDSASSRTPDALKQLLPHSLAFSLSISIFVTKT